MPRVLILGGTTEARRLATALHTPTPSPHPSPRPASCAFSVITSLAGRTSSPLLPPGEVRIGGFGGPEGLAAYLRAERIDVLVDATHPFAAGMSANAAAAATALGLPLIALRRPGWHEAPGDDWHRVPDLPSAAALLPHLGRRVFLTTGRQGIAAFAAVDAWFLARSVEPPTPPMPARLEVLLDRGPFTLDGERRLLADHHIDVLVTKDSGGPAAKLTAARERGLPVVMIDRPPLGPGVVTAASIEEVVAHLLRV
ncbi:cobalt-precorrin-6A reductase [Actinoplanes sp. NPDC049596]|uniref:cobalt-precorrin-6A reductase n=1 Tax=unclassified Actinoplanes TaxID=2626549 RepID=UPI003435E4A2